MLRRIWSALTRRSLRRSASSYSKTQVSASEEEQMSAYLALRMTSSVTQKHVDDLIEMNDVPAYDCESCTFGRLRVSPATEEGGEALLMFVDDEQGKIKQASAYTLYPPAV